MNLGVLSNIVATVKSDPPPRPSYFCCCYFACLLICVVIYLDLPGLSCVIHFLWDMWPLMALFSWFLFLFFCFLFLILAFLRLCLFPPSVVAIQYWSEIIFKHIKPAWLPLTIVELHVNLDLQSKFRQLSGLHLLCFLSTCAQALIKQDILACMHTQSSQPGYLRRLSSASVTLSLPSHYICLSRGSFTFVFAQAGLQPQIGRTPGFPHLLGSHITAPRGMDYFTFFKSSQSSSSETAGDSQPTLWRENYHTE